MITANFCECNNCQTVMYDQNPKTDANELDVTKYPDATEMQFMQGLIENDDNDLFWACPVCLTDEYLTDL